MPFTFENSTLLNDGCLMPNLCFGVYKINTGEDTYNAVKRALELGYRGIDTAAIYRNEQDVGRAIFDSKIPRSDIWIQTKLWDKSQGYVKAMEAAKLSLEKLNIDYIDLYIIHSPRKGAILRKESWNALIDLKKQGKVKSIGVSNFGIKHLEELMADSDIVPSVNQIDIHPFNQRIDLAQFCLKNNIVCQAYSPLTRGMKLDNSVLLKLAAKKANLSSLKTPNKKLHITPAQILLKWAAVNKLPIVVKSVTDDHMIENITAFTERQWNLNSNDVKILNRLEECFLAMGWDATTVD